MTFCVLGLVSITAGSSYAIFSDVSSQEDYNTVTTGTLQLAYEDTQSLSLNNLYPVSDEVGMQGDGYTFTVRNVGTLPSDYKVMIQDDTAMIEADGCSDHLLPKANIKVSVNGGTPFLLSNIEESNYMITTGNLQPGASVTHVVKVWIDEASGNEVLGTHFHGKIIVEGVQGEFRIEPNAPELVEGMIPVIYSQSQSNWVKADVTSAWYDYYNQEWANAVTVTATNRDVYKNAEVGTIIPMEDINTMWVWIPRYEYMYTNLGDQYAGGTKDQPGEIKINFLSGTTTSSNSEEYKVHPAFTFGGTEITGLWYGKFEMGGTLTDSCFNDGCDTSNVVIKPNAVSLKNETVSSFYFLMQSMQDYPWNPYGFVSNSGNLHMSKGNEWGAVAYLSQSRYGKYGNPNYEGVAKEVAINNCSNHITGIGGDTVDASASATSCTINTYETEKGQSASTTGNITGVYDMSGGSYEYMMENYNNDKGYSGFTQMPESKYYNLYTSSNSSMACGGIVCYGYALTETAGWYNNSFIFGLSEGNSWLVRGDYYNTGGVFSVGDSRGYALGSTTSRAAITP